MSFDSVYMFHWAGWRKEVVSNRWQYSKRWARTLPVVMLQPTLLNGQTAYAEPDGRIDGLTLLHIQNSGDTTQEYLAAAPQQAAQIFKHMKDNGHKAPLIWLYNPNLVMPFALVPGAGRIYHATENYFDFKMPNSDLADLTSCVVQLSDAVICCSSGVAAGIKAATGRDTLDTVPNGCDYPIYSQPQPLRSELREAMAPLDRFARKAIFAGNINLRMDFPLMLRVAQEAPDTGFLYVGPYDAPYLNDEDRKNWAELCQLPNVLYLPPVQLNDLPPLYAAVDLGIIPYRHDPLLTRNGFPLKALEMGASGLPVVSTLMEPLRSLQIADAFLVAENNDDFANAVKTMSRQTMTAEARTALDQLCRRHDYDQHFQTVQAILDERIPDREPRGASLDVILQRLGPNRYIGAPYHRGERSGVIAKAAAFLFSHSAADLLHHTLAAVWERMPIGLRNRIPRSFVSAIRQLIT